MIRTVVGEFIDKRVPVMGKEEDWDEYMIHWGNLTQVTELDEKTGSVKRKIWVKNGQSDFPFATVYWRIGMARFGSNGSVIGAPAEGKSIPLGINEETTFNDLMEANKNAEQDEWRL